MTKNFRLGKLEECRTSLREPLRIMAGKLAIDFHSPVSIQKLQEELISFTTYKNRISEWKGELCDVLKNNLNRKTDAIKNAEENQSEYLLNHSFILIQNRAKNKLNPQRITSGK